MATKFSILTPSYNQRRFIEQTAASILTQTGPFDLEWHVIDAASTDGTVEFLQSLNDPRLKWTSHKDRGQADALNQGLARATGDIIGWLNSDDLYLPGALAIVAGAFAGHPESHWLVGRCQIIGEDGRIIRRAITAYKDRKLDRYSYRHLLRENPISQPAVFWRKSFGDAIGPLDVSLHHTMDYDLWLRMGRAAAPLILPETLASFRFHPSSKSGQEDRGRFRQEYAIANRYLGNDHLSRLIHRINTEKIVLSYRLLRLLGR
jgi:glycosyltransferase involved in cell wall biosynthesis